MSGLVTAARRRRESRQAAPAAASTGASSFRLSAAQEAAVLETRSHVIKNLREYRNRNEETMNYFEEHMPEYYRDVVYNLTPEQKTDPSRFYYAATRDFKYDRLISTPMTAFCSHGKKWKDEAKTKQYGFSHIRKYHDAILKCSEYSGGSHVSQEYRDEMNAYIKSMEREKSVAKQNNQIEERKEADPIGIDLYSDIATWAIEEGTPGGILIWASSVTQWNCMGRPINVDSLGFHNMRKGVHDSIVISYDKNKKDQTGNKVSPKNIYTNPLKPAISFFLAMGCYLCINQDRYSDNRRNDKIFIKTGRDGSASDSYQKGLKKLLSDPTKKQKIMDSSVRDGHFHAYGYRKGSATHATTGTMEPPPIPSVMLRGEWSLGGSLDVYWFFSLVGDTYLGRILAGFDPDGVDIDTLPPHFREGMENKYIEEAMKLTFGSILERFPTMQSCLLLFLASIVYHQSFLRHYFEKNSKHPFNDIAILHDQDLMEKLTGLVTLEPCQEVTQPTGVPRYTKLLKLVGEIVKGNNKVLEAVQTEVASIPKLVRDSINATAAKAGNVTAPMVLAEVEKVTERIEEIVTTQVRAALSEYRQLVPAPAVVVATPTAPSLNLDRGNAGTIYPTYSYIDPDAKGRKKKDISQVFAVPLDFSFPTPCLRNAWFYWFRGCPDNKSKKEDGSGLYSAPVPPFKHLAPKMLPHKKRRHYNDCWTPILQYMEEAVKSNELFVPFPSAPSSQIISDSFEAAKAALKEEHPSLFEKKGHGTWSVSTWSKELRLSSRKRKATALS